MTMCPQLRKCHFSNNTGTAAFSLRKQSVILLGSHSSNKLKCLDKFLKATKAYHYGNCKKKKGKKKR